LLKINRLLFRTLGSLVKSKYGLSYFSSVLNPLEKSFISIDQSIVSMLQPDKKSILALCYMITGLAKSFSDYSNLSYLMSWFTEKWDGVLIRIFESYSSDGEITAAIIKLFTTLISSKAFDHRSFSALSIGGEYSVDSLLLTLFKDAGRLISILTSKIALSEASKAKKTSSQEVTFRLKPLSLVLRLLDSILDCSIPLYGAMKFYGDEDIFNYVQAATGAVLACPFMEVVVYEKLFFYLVKMNRSLIKNHIKTVAKSGNNLLSPLLGTTLEAIQMPNLNLRSNASDILLYIMEYRYRNFLNPVWKKSNTAKQMEEILSLNSELIVNCFEAMMDNFMVGNAEKYPEFEFPIFLISLNYPSILRNYQKKILSYQKNDQVREKVNAGFNTLLTQTSWVYLDDDNLDDFKINLTSFSEEIGQLAVRVTQM